MEKNREEFRPGDRVTLSRKGLAFFETRRFPAIVGAIYSNILGHNTEVLRVDGDHVRLKLIKLRFPAEKGKNDFGILMENLRVVKYKEEGVTDGMEKGRV